MYKNCYGLLPCQVGDSAAISKHQTIVEEFHGSFEGCHAKMVINIQWIANFEIVGNSDQTSKVEVGLDTPVIISAHFEHQF